MIWNLFSKAKEIFYNNGTSGLQAANIQNAIDEVASDIGEINGKLGKFETKQLSLTYSAGNGLKSLANYIYQSFNNGTIFSGTLTHNVVYSFHGYKVSAKYGTVTLTWYGSTGIPETYEFSVFNGVVSEPNRVVYNGNLNDMFLIVGDYGISKSVTANTPIDISIDCARDGYTLISASVAYQNSIYAQVTLNIEGNKVRAVIYPLTNFDFLTYVRCVYVKNS